MLKTRLDLNESEAFSIAHYKEGLKWEIEERLAVQSFQNLDDLVLAAQHVEQLMERGKTKSRVPYNTPTNNYENSRPLLQTLPHTMVALHPRHVFQDRLQIARDHLPEIPIDIMQLLNVTYGMRKVTNQMYIQNEGQLI